jgi:hypothetical protein
MATMYENLCGNCVSGIELTFQNCATMNCQRHFESPNIFHVHFSNSQKTIC